MPPIHSQNNGQKELKSLQYEILQLLNSLIVYLLKRQNKVQIKYHSSEEYSQIMLQETDTMSFLLSAHGELMCLENLQSACCLPPSFTNLKQRPKAVWLLFLNKTQHLQRTHPIKQRKLLLTSVFYTPSLYWGHAPSFRGKRSQLGKGWGRIIF